MRQNAKEILANAKRVDVNDDWFEVIELPGNVYGIFEAKHWQRVCSFLILGSRKAVLFDTGMGIHDISSVVEKLTDLEIMVINSHIHFDHIGDNWRYPENYVFEEKSTINLLIKGHTNDMLWFDIQPDMFLEGYPDGFDPKKYVIKPIDKDKIRFLHQGDKIDMGGRKLEVLHTPGHTNDSIMLLDRESKALFTGDTFYPDWLFAFMDGEFGDGKSDIEVYEQTMKKTAELVPDLDFLYPCHTEALVDPDILIDVANAFEAVRKGEVEYKIEDLYGEKRRLYEFERFAIVTKI